MRFLFITKPFFIEPLGTMYLSSSIKQRGHEVDLVTTSEDYEKKVNEFSPEVIGYSIMTGDQDFYESINRKLKQKHNFFSIAGGPHPTFFPEMLKKSSLDAICIGEGEKSLQDFLENPESHEIPNFHFKNGNGIITNPVYPLIGNLNEVPFPDRELVFKYPEVKNGSIKHFIASRGCPYNCSYCFNESYSEIYNKKGKRVRFRSVDNLLGEVKEVLDTSPTKFVYFQDDTFILDSKWVKEFSEKYPKITSLPFHCHIRANLAKEEIIKDLKSAGCYSVHIAAESGNAKIRKEVLNRNMSDEQIISSVELLKKYDIKVMLQNILGLPFTTLKNDFETLELNIKCQPDYSWASIFQPYPKTRLGKKSVESGAYKGDFSDIGNNFFDSSVLDIENKNEIANLQKLFAIAVSNPELYYSGLLQKLIELPYDSTREKFTEIYKDFRKRGDKILYGFDL
ncbi:Radical SAM superfamily protein [uncultured archaeon]|nr:Radical SAM superfamily protein [uncultured archaeon]